MKTIKYLLTVVCAIFALGSLMAQVAPSTSGGGGSVPSAPDLSMLTNHAALVGYAFKQVKGVQVSIASGAQANNWQNGGFFQITNDVKSLDVLADAISPFWWGLQLTDTKAYVSLNAQLWNTGDVNAVGNQDTYALFYAYGGGQPIKTPYGYWTLTDEASQLQLQLASQIKIKVPGVVDARLVVQDGSGNDYGVQIGLTGNGEMWFPSDYAGVNSTIVLTTQFQGTDGYWYSYTKAYDLRKNVEVQLTQVMVHILLRDSDDFKSFKDSQVMDVQVYSYQGYGKVPLVMVTFGTNQTNTVSLSVHTTDGQYATSYSIENQQTKKINTVTVPAGATSVNVGTNIFTKGVHYIIPLGIDLKQGYYWYGGKG